MTTLDEARAELAERFTGVDTLSDDDVQQLWRIVWAVTPYTPVDLGGRPGELLLFLKEHGLTRTPAEIERLAKLGLR